MLMLRTGCLACALCPGPLLTNFQHCAAAGTSMDLGMQVDAYTPLKHVLQQLWALWELLVLGEPLLVAAPTPGQTSVVRHYCPVECGYRPCRAFPSGAHMPLKILSIPGTSLPCHLSTVCRQAESLDDKLSCLPPACSGLLRCCGGATVAAHALPIRRRLPAVPHNT